MSADKDTKVTVGIERITETETWLACALRHAAPYGLGIEILEWYNRGVAAGKSEEDAALDACMEWDVCVLFREGE